MLALLRFTVNKSLTVRGPQGFSTLLPAKLSFPKNLCGAGERGKQEELAAMSEPLDWASLSWLDADASSYGCGILSHKADREV